MHERVKPKPLPLPFSWSRVALIWVGGRLSLEELKRGSVDGRSLKHTILERGDVREESPSVRECVRIPWWQHQNLNYRIFVSIGAYMMIWTIYLQQIKEWYSTVSVFPSKPVKNHIFSMKKRGFCGENRHFALSNISIQFSTYWLGFRIAGYS